MLTSFCHQVLIEKGTRDHLRSRICHLEIQTSLGFTTGTKVKQMLDFKKDTNMVFLFFLSI